MEVGGSSIVSRTILAPISAWTDTQIRAPVRSPHRCAWRGRGFERRARQAGQQPHATLGRVAQSQRAPHPSAWVCEPSEHRQTNVVIDDVLAIVLAMAAHVAADQHDGFAGPAVFTAQSGNRLIYRIRRDANCRNAVQLILGALAINPNPALAEGLTDNRIGTMSPNAVVIILGGGDDFGEFVHGVNIRKLRSVGKIKLRNFVSFKCIADLEKGTPNG